MNEQQLGGGMHYVIGTLEHFVGDGMDISSQVRFTTMHPDLIPHLLEDWASAHHSYVTDASDVTKVRVDIEECIGKWEYVGRYMNTVVKNYQVVPHEVWDALWTIEEVDLEVHWLDDLGGERERYVR
jgi:hypothetical protein